MPADTEEPLSLAAAAKAHFQPTPAPREVKAPEVNQPEKKAESKAPEPPRAPEKKDPDDKKDVKPVASEEDVVFGSPVKEKKVESKGPSDDEFEKSLKDETAGMTEKASAKWIELRRSTKTANDKCKAMEEQMRTAAEAGQASKGDDLNPKLESANARIAALEAELADAEKVLSVTQVERTKQFRREVSEPMDELTKQVDEMAGRYEVSAKTILAALNEDTKTRNATLSELAADFSEPDRVDLYTLAKDMDRLRRKGDTLRERAKTDLSALEQEEADANARQTAEQRRTFATSAERVWNEASKALDFLNHHPNAPEWNAALDTAKAQSLAYTPGQDAAADGRMIAEAITARFVRKALDHRTKERDELIAERDALLARIQKDNALDPNLDGSRGEEGGGEDTGDGTNDSMTIGQRIKARVGR